MSDYTEHLISAAGSDGEPYGPVTLTRSTVDTCIIALVKAMHAEQSATARVRIAVAIKDIRLAAMSTPAPAPRSEDFTITELFGMYATITSPQGTACSECGALVEFLDKHATWHNKLLP